MDFAITSFLGKYGFLSNFYPSPKTPPTLEHHYHAAKVLSDGWRDRILNAVTPGEAKRTGRIAPLRKDWEQVKDQVMLDLVRLKFSDPGLRQLLLDTGSVELFEGNTWHDNYWGVCRCGWCDKLKADGQNKLGEILMQVRSELK